MTPFPLTGKIDRVVVSVNGQPFSHVAHEVENAFTVQQPCSSPAELGSLRH